MKYVLNKQEVSDAVFNWLVTKLGLPAGNYRVHTVAEMTENDITVTVDLEKKE